MNADSWEQMMLLPVTADISGRISIILIYIA